MVTGYEVDMYRNIGSIAQSLRTIANCMQAAEKRARRMEALGLPPGYDKKTLLEQAQLILDAHGQLTTTPEDIERMGAAIAAVRRGFVDLERQNGEETHDPA